MEYRDFKETVTHGIASAFRLFAHAADVCNGFLLAYRLFFLEAADFLAAEGVTAPLPVLIRELQAQVETPSWRILGALETRYADDKPGLRLLVDSSLEDDREVLQSGGCTYECSRRRATTYEPIQTFANGEAVTVVKGCCSEAIDAVDHAVNPRQALKNGSRRHVDSADEGEPRV